ncbi:MAG: hypothetical protein A3K66_00735 [Euryarchaeota archaeon RBG_16_67_27]|nr:MAG: hypothetical protein A3K66_00735 [Euryarchaeota archaeon RBG_16_67_27]
MPEFTLTLREVREEATDTRTFAFDSEPRVVARPGQYLLVSLDAPGDPRRGSRSLSIASAPSDPGLLLTTRVRTASPFKRALDGLAVGDRIRAKGPLGRFYLPEGDAPAVLIAGGIGVTPFRAMVRASIDAGRRSPVSLITSDRTPDSIVFREEFDAWSVAHPWFTVTRTVTRPAESGAPWTGPVGRIDERRIGPALRAGAVLVAGPPSFADGMQALLASAGIPGDRVQIERFQGY